MSEQNDVLGRFRSPRGWGITVDAYRRYVVQEIREQLTFDEILVLMHGLRCSLGELPDQVVAAKMAGPVTPVAAALEASADLDLRGQVEALTDAMQSILRNQQDTAARVLKLAADLAALQGRGGA